jgi:hypothetical protein
MAVEGRPNDRVLRLADDVHAAILNNREHLLKARGEVKLALSPKGETYDIRFTFTF